MKLLYDGINDMMTVVTDMQIGITVFKSTIPYLNFGTAVFKIALPIRIS
jgi:hypothetical protein